LIIDFTIPLPNKYHCAVAKEPDGSWLLEGKYPGIQIGDTLKILTNNGIIFLEVEDRQYCKYQSRIFNFHGFAKEVLEPR